MKFTYDPHADAINITFREGKVVKTVEIAPEIILDLDKKGEPLYLEIIGAKEKIGKDSTQEITMKNIIFEKEKVLTK